MDGEIDNPAARSENPDLVWLPSRKPPTGKAATSKALAAWLNDEVREAVGEYVREGCFWLQGGKLQFLPAAPMVLTTDPRCEADLHAVLTEVIESNCREHADGKRVEQPFLAGTDREGMLVLRETFLQCIHKLDDVLGGRPREVPGPAPEAAAEHVRLKNENARLRAIFTGGDEEADPKIWPLGWLHCLLSVCNETGNFDAICGDDPDAHSEMLSEIGRMVADAKAILGVTAI